MTVSYAEVQASQARAHAAQAAERDLESALRTRLGLKLEDLEHLSEWGVYQALAHQLLAQATEMQAAALAFLAEAVGPTVPEAQKAYWTVSGRLAGMREILALTEQARAAESA